MRGGGEDIFKLNLETVINLELYVIFCFSLEVKQFMCSNRNVTLNVLEVKSFENF